MLLASKVCSRLEPIIFQVLILIALKVFAQQSVQTLPAQVLPPKRSLFIASRAEVSTQGHNYDRNRRASGFSKQH